MNKRTINGKNVLSIALGINPNLVEATNNPTIFKVGNKHYYVLTDNEYCRILRNYVEDYINNSILAHAYGTPVMNWLNIAEIRTSLQRIPFYELLNLNKNNLYKHVVMVEDNGEVRKSVEWYNQLLKDFSRTPFKDMERIKVNGDLVLYDETYNIYETYNEGL